MHEMDGEMSRDAREMTLRTDAAARTVDPDRSMLLAEAGTGEVERPAPKSLFGRVALSSPHPEMFSMKILFAVALALFLTAASGHAHAAEPAGLTIDVPVVLKKADVVMNMDHLAFDGKQPFGLVYMRLMTERFAEDKTDWRIVAVFHGPAGYMILGDKAYDKVRKTRTGNPYRAEIEKLQKAGVRFELCGQTAKENKWGNADLLANVEVNSGANFRIVELVQDGYVQIQP